MPRNVATAPHAASAQRGLGGTKHERDARSSSQEGRARGAEAAGCSTGCAFQASPFLQASLERAIWSLLPMRKCHGWEHGLPRRMPGWLPTDEKSRIGESTLRRSGRGVLAAPRSPPALGLAAWKVSFSFRRSPQEHRCARKGTVGAQMSSFGLARMLPQGFLDFRSSPLRNLILRNDDTLRAEVPSRLAADRERQGAGGMRKGSKLAKGMPSRASKVIRSPKLTVERPRGSKHEVICPKSRS